MKKNAAIILGMILLGQFSSAAVTCDDTAIKKKAVHNFPGAGYWMQASGNCRLTYTSIGGVDSKMYNLCDRKTETITEDIDAFGLPEGDLYVQPSNGISFLKISDAVAKGNDARPIYSDYDLMGNYQSVGTLAGTTTETERTVRIAMGSNAGMLRDYKIKKTGADDFTVAPVGPVTQICQNIPGGSLDREIPMISRDGTMISGRDMETRRTNIYKIEMPSGNCQLLSTTPTSTGKVTFTFDNKKIMYVASDQDTGKGRLMSMDVATGKATVLSGPTEDVQYVTTRKDGTVFYSRSLESTGGYDMVELAPGMLAEGGNQKRSEALGLLWADACGLDVDYDQAFAIGRRLESATCSQIITQDNVAKLEDEYAQIKLDDLRAECRSGAGSGSNSTGTR